MWGWLQNKKKLLSSKAELGRWGERSCEKYLTKKGYKVLVRNFTCKSGEIDLIVVASDGSLVFVEVKARADEDFGAAEEVVTFAKKQKMIRAARYFIASNSIDDRALRFDVVVIILGQKGKPQIRHYESAFTP